MSTDTSTALEDLAVDWPPYGLWFPSTDAYYSSHDLVSHSALEVFRKSIPRYYGQYVTGELEPPRPTAEMEFGSCLHAWLLEREIAGQVFAVAPNCDRRTKAGREAWAQFEAAANGKILLTPEQYKLLETMAAAIAANPTARLLLGDQPHALTEQAIVWRCPETGSACKAKLDRYFPEGLILDLKTTEDPDPASFRRTAANYGYHRQAAWYLDGASRALDVACQFLFVVIGRKAPHEVIVYELDVEALALGHRENQELLYRLAECRRSGTWASRWADQVQTLSFPRWAFAQED